MAKPKLSTPVRILLGVAISTLDRLAGVGRNDLLWHGEEAVGKVNHCRLHR